MTKSKPHLLVVEDEADVRDLIALHLKREGYTFDAVQDGEEALIKIQNREYDLFVLDWMLPKMSGLELIKTLRGNLRAKQPILMVTARVESADIVLGLETGADDYISKPFEVPVLLARVRALLRRTGGEEPSAKTLRIGALEIDMDAHEVSCEKNKIPLTASEFRLLTALAQNQGRVLTRDQLIDLVRGEDISIVSRAIDTHVFGLRKKLGACSEVVETIRGVGYRIKSTA